MRNYINHVKFGKLTDMPTHVRDVTFKEDSENIVGCLLQAACQNWCYNFPCTFLQK